MTDISHTGTPHTGTPHTGTSAKHLYLVDGSGYIFRAFHALPPMNRSDGTPVNAVLGFSSMLYKLIEDLKGENAPSHLAVIFDAGRFTFRNDIYPEYKAHRPDPPEDLVPQFSIIREATEAFGVPAVDLKGYEADDLIATYARRAEKDGFKVTIISSDKDLMQLVSNNITMLDAMKNKRIGIKEVIEKFGVKPEKVIDVQALAGDSVDNVPGVPGIGIKTAAQLIEEYGSLDQLLAQAGGIKQTKRRENLIEFADQARISYRLVQLKDDIETPYQLENFIIKEPNPENLIAFVETQQFRSLKIKILQNFDRDLISLPTSASGDLANNISGALQDREIKETSYECVLTHDDLEKWIKRITQAGRVAVDTETTSLRIRDARLVGISLSVTPGEAAYIPFGHTGGDDMLAEAPVQLVKKDVIAALKPVLEDPAILKIGQNLKYDISILKAEGITLTPLEDTMLMSYALDAGLHGHGMNELAELHLNLSPIPFKQVAGTGKSQKTFDQIPLDKATEYAAEDADITLRLAHVLKPRLATEHVTKVYETLERPLIPVLARMERRGIKVNAGYLKKLSHDFAIAIDRLKEDIHSLAGESFNIASPKQLGEILFDKQGLSGGVKSKKTGAWSTNVDVLEALAAEGNELAKKVLEYRSFAKLKSTYTDALSRDINQYTGRVHTSYHLAATTTGRLSSNDPNLQNIPIRTEEGRKIRAAFIAEEGCALIAADYSQIELRLLAHMADIPTLKQAFADGIDIHALTASEVFGVPLDGMDASTRRKAKAINFGIIYGISAFGLARQLAIPRGEAQDYIDAYFNKFPGIKTYMATTIEFAKKHGYVETLFGRKVHIKSLSEKTPRGKGFGERAAVNAPIQGTAADIIRRAMIRMDSALAQNGLEPVQMLLQVHDELVFEAPLDLVDQAIPVIKSVMETASQPVTNISVPLIVEAGTGNHWGEAH